MHFKRVSSNTPCQNGNTEMYSAWQSFFRSRRACFATLTASTKPDRLGSKAMPPARWKKAPASGVGGKAGAFGGRCTLGVHSPKPKNAIRDSVPRYIVPRCHVERRGARRDLALRDGNRTLGLSLRNTMHRRPRQQPRKLDLVIMLDQPADVGRADGRQAELARQTQHMSTAASAAIFTSELLRTLPPLVVTRRPRVRSSQSASG